MFGGKIGLPELLVVITFLLTFGSVFALLIVGWAKIFSKAGLPPVLCLVMVIPVVNFIAFLWFAFSAWPMQKTDAVGSASPQVGSALTP